MKKVWIILAAVSLISCGKENDPAEKGSVIRYDPVDVPKSNSIHTFVHYMPWFETPQSSGKWGLHWTMDTRNPEVIDSEGKREIASHFYPVIGPYASGDHDVIEYHLLLMKYCGIDGVLIDWYGSTDINDYASNRSNAEALINLTEEVGLNFAIVYEDRTISAVTGQDNSIDRITAAQDDMIYLSENYFTRSNYIKIDGHPLLMVFGPEEFHQPDEWSQIFYPVDEVCFLVLNYKSAETAPYSIGEYIWVDNTSLDNKYSTKDHFEVFMGGAYPGFHDYYEEGGWGNGLGWEIDHDNGSTFSENLEKAKNAGINYLQLITWNDFGEGTMIEPTNEFGFTFLKQTQLFTGVSFNETILEKITMQYLLRKKLNNHADAQKMLDQSFYYLVSLQTEKAIEIIDQLEKSE